MNTYRTYCSSKWGEWAQYCRQNAGYYPDFPRKRRRELEIAAHRAGIKQVPRIMHLKLTPNELQQLLVDASKD